MREFKEFRNKLNETFWRAPKPKEGTIRIIDLSTAHPDNRLGAKEKTGFQHQRWTNNKFVNQGKPYKSKRDAEKARSSGQHSMQFEAKIDNQVQRRVVTRYAALMDKERQSHKHDPKMVKMFDRDKGDGIFAINSIFKRGDTKSLQRMDTAARDIVHNAFDDRGVDIKKVVKGIRESLERAMQFEAVDPYKGHPRDAATRKGYTLYHKTYTDAINHALAHHEHNGHTISDDTRDRKIAMGPRKPGSGKTVSHNLPAEQKNRRIHMQIYNRGGKTPFELNTYSS